MHVKDVYAYKPFYQFFILDNNNNLYTTYNSEDKLFLSSDPGVYFTMIYSNVTKFESRGNTVAIIINSRCYLLGDNASGQLGTGNTGEIITQPLDTGIDNVVDFYISSTNVFLVTSDGTIYAAGDNSSGQLGLTKSSVLYFTPISITNPKKIVIDENANYILTKDGDLYISGTPLNTKTGVAGISSVPQFTKINGSNLIKDFKVKMGDILAYTYKNSLYALGNDITGKLGLNNQDVDVLTRINIGFVETLITDIYLEDTFSFIIDNKNILMSSGTVPVGESI